MNAIESREIPERRLSDENAGADVLSFGTDRGAEYPPARDSEPPAGAVAALIPYRPLRMPVTLPVSGWDNKTGAFLRTAVVLLPDSPPASFAVPERLSKQPDRLAACDPPEVIYLFGEIGRMPSRLRRAVQKVLTPRFYAGSLLSLLLLLPLFAFYSIGNFCYLKEEGAVTAERKVVWTAANSPREIAGKVVLLHEADAVAVEDFGSTKMLTVIRSYPVSLTADGKTETVQVLDKTVAELLAEQGVSLSPDDLLSHAPDTALLGGEEIVVRRVTYLQREVTETVPFEQIRRASPMLSEEAEVLVRDGADGSARRIYRDRLVDGELDSSEIMEEEMLEEPTDEITVVGDPLVPASFLKGSDFTEIEIVDGAPASYDRVMESAVCTAYSYSPGVWGASGMYLIQGFVATNPEVIPYGTLMYIASDTFTYGWAVAADCGTAMMEGIVDIDCFFETYDESLLFGKKALDVYIIGQLTQSQLSEYAANGMFYGRIPESAGAA